VDAALMLLELDAVWLADDLDRRMGGA